MDDGQREQLLLRSVKREGGEDLRQVIHLSNSIIAGRMGPLDRQRICRKVLTCFSQSEWLTSLELCSDGI